MFRVITLCLGVGILLINAGCSRQPDTQVVTTTSIIADVVRRIAGDTLSVHCLMGPGIDPHRYQPSPSDLGKLTSAKLVFYNGLHLEGKMTDVLEHATSFKAVAVTRKLDRQTQLHRANTDGGEFDPHIWFDVRLWKVCAETVRDELIATFPEQAEVFRKNAAVYLSELDELHQYVQNQADSLSPDRRVLVTSHDAFGYFGKAYGFEVYGLQGVSTSSESSIADVEAIAKVIGDRPIPVPALFTETSVPPQGLQAVLTVVRTRYKYTVNLVGDADALYSDALGDAGTTGATYAGMVRHNIDVIVKALKK